MSNRLWTDEERAILREVYAANPVCRGRAGAGRHHELLRRLPGRTWPGIHNQIVMLGLAHPGTPTKKKERSPGLAGRVYECLTRHGALRARDIAELLGSSLGRVTNAIGHLASKQAICPSADKHSWQIASGEVGFRPLRRQTTNWEAGITEEDRAWMRKYREQRNRRIALMNQRHANP